METGTETNPRKRVDYEPTKTANLGDISAVSANFIPDSMASLRQGDEPQLEALTEVVLLWAKEVFGQDQIVAALADFHKLTGTFNFDDAFYHERTSYFLDYFVFQRPLPPHLTNGDGAATPLHCFLKAQAIASHGLPQRVNEAFSDLVAFRHSVFAIAKVLPTSCVVVDLVTKVRLEIEGQGRHIFEQMPKALIFQGFIFNFDGKNHISQGIICHSHDARRYIKANVKQAMKAKDFSELGLLFSLAKQNLAFARLKRIDAKTAYSQRKV